MDEIEPFLLRIELILRTPRGRKATEKTYTHLGVTPTDSSSDDSPQRKLFE